LFPVRFGEAYPLIFITGEPLSTVSRLPTKTLAGVSDRLTSQITATVTIFRAGLTFFGAPKGEE